MSKEKQRQLDEINRPMNEELYNNIEKQYQELAKVKTDSEQIEEKNCKKCLHFNACCKWTDFPKQIGFPTCRRFAPISGYRKQSEGEWIDQYNGKYANPIYVCSLCGKGTLLTPYINELNNMEMIQALSPFCPNCGAKMKGESK